MISLDLLRTDPDLLRDTIRRRGIDVDVDRLIELDDDLRQVVARSGTVRAALRRQVMSRGPDDPAATRALREEMAAVTEQVRALQEARDELAGRLPNLVAPDTPGSNVELHRAGEALAADEAHRYDTVGAALGILSHTAAMAGAAPSPESQSPGKLSSWHRTSWRGDGARLVWAMFTHVQDVLHTRGFTPLLLPSDQVLLDCYGDQVVEAGELPIRLCGLLPGRSVEVPGLSNRDGYRTHQVEQVVLCRAEDAPRWLDECRRNVADLLQNLQLPYRVVRVGVGELDPAAYEAYAIECWFPGSGGYLSTHTIAHCTDYQARRLKIRYLERGRVSQPHTVSATAVSDHTVLAILENHLQPDGSVRIPEALRHYLGGRELIEPPPPAAPPRRPSNLG